MAQAHSHLKSLHRMKTSLLLPIVAALAIASDASAFCGFYVAKADSKLYNESSQVVLVRDGKRTQLTMANDYQGDPKEFALVIPVPTVIEKDDVDVMEKAIIDHLDAYTAPRLVEYWDSDPERSRYPATPMVDMSAPGARRKMTRQDGAKALGVTIKREFSKGEYDIMVLAAEQSNGLITWLNGEGYKIPEGATDVIQSYIAQDMKFFVAKVNLERQAKQGRTWLRPLRVSFNSKKFMLPIRLGTVNAKGPQDLIIYALTRQGRLESTNYRTVRLPTNLDIPPYLKNEFGDFYRAMFARAVEIEKMSSVFIEYFWDMGWCDPCSSDPIPNIELRALGVDWLKGENEQRPQEGEVYITRLHVRYDREHFPEDLVFQETGDHENLQGRYVMRHPWTGKADTEARKTYFDVTLPKRREAEAQTLARMTNWDIDAIRAKQRDYKSPQQKKGE